MATPGYMRVDTSLGAPDYHTPICDDSLKPFLGQNFQTVEHGVSFYRIYAEASGFDVRIGTRRKFKDGSTSLQYIYCNREGEKNAATDDVSSSTSIKRRRVSRRVGCRARVVFKFCSVNGYVVDHFEEHHSHPLVTDELKKFLKANRKVGVVHENFILNCARANIGPMKSFRLFKEVVGGYSNVGATGNDFKNHSRDLRAYIVGCDAQMILNKMHAKKESCSAFFFDYFLDAKDNLKCLFWSDPISRRNYSIFGDVVSFDCTYKTNGYKMIFAPFTGKDNHGKCITFGAALLSGENQKDYTWAFQKFVECMGHAPAMLITDQDPAMMVSIKQTLPDTRHRLCMWHIMMKLPEKVPLHLKKDDSFNKRFNDVVWSDLIEPSVFDEQWNSIMVDFGLTGEKWFTAMFEIREHWIPAYFREHPMSGLCRTTSISESVNSFFSHYLNKGSNIVEFMMHYESALDAQRNSNDLQNNVDCTSIPDLKTPLLFEKHAATIYTTKQFYKVQEEIEASCYNCSVVGITQTDVGCLYNVDEGSFDSHQGLDDCGEELMSRRLFIVSYNKADVTIQCSCKKFVREGLLCCHIYLIFKHLKWVEIPDKYIVHRWTKSAYMKPINPVINDDMVRCVRIEENKKLINQLVSDIYSCVGAAEGDMEKMHTLVGGIRDLKEILVTVDGHGSSSSQKNKSFELFYGAPKPVEVVVHPPLQVKTKGSGSRLISRRNAAIERAKKPLRLCSKCNQYARHDARNCKEIV